MILLFTFWKLRSIARELAQTISSEAWKTVIRISEESEKASPVLKVTKDGNRVLDGVAVVMAFGLHIVDHYSRNFLNERARNRLVQKMISSLMGKAKASHLLAASAGRSTGTKLIEGEKSLLKSMDGVCEKFERCNLMHRGGPGYRGDLERTSLDMCGRLLMCAFIEDCDGPQSKLQSWEKLDPKTLRLYDLGRALAWDVHERVREDLYRLFSAAGFQQISAPQNFQTGS